MCLYLCISCVSLIIIITGNAQLWVLSSTCLTVRYLAGMVFDMFPLSMKKSDKPHMEILGIPIGDQDFYLQKHFKANVLLPQLEEVGIVDPQSFFVSVEPFENGTSGPGNSTNACI